MYVLFWQVLCVHRYEYGSWGRRGDSLRSESVWPLSDHQQGKHNDQYINIWYSKPPGIKLRADWFIGWLVDWLSDWLICDRWWRATRTQTVWTTRACWRSAGFVLTLCSSWWLNWSAGWRSITTIPIMLSEHTHTHTHTHCVNTDCYIYNIFRPLFDFLSSSFRIFYFLCNETVFMSTWCLINLYQGKYECKYLYTYSDIYDILC